MLINPQLIRLGDERKPASEHPVQRMVRRKRDVIRRLVRIHALRERDQLRIPQDDAPGVISPDVLLPHVQRGIRVEEVENAIIAWMRRSKLFHLRIGRLAQVKSVQRIARENEQFGHRQSQQQPHRQTTLSGVPQQPGHDQYRRPAGQQAAPRHDSCLKRESRILESLRPQIDFSHDSDRTHDRIPPAGARHARTRHVYRCCRRQRQQAGGAHTQNEGAGRPAPFHQLIEADAGQHREE